MTSCLCHLRNEVNTEGQSLRIRTAAIIHSVIAESVLGHGTEIAVVVNGGGLGRATMIVIVRKDLVLLPHILPSHPLLPPLVTGTRVAALNAVDRDLKIETGREILGKVVVTLISNRRVGLVVVVAEIIIEMKNYHQMIGVVPR